MKLDQLMQESEQDIHDVMSLVKNAKASNEQRQNTRGFALENDDGSIVKVFVREDQADEFEAVISKALYDAADEGIEIPEVLFNLRKHFEIVDVDWGKGSIPEDEEEPVKVTEPTKDKELPPSDEPAIEGNDDEVGGEESGDELLDMDLGDLGDLGDDADAKDGIGQDDIMGVLSKIMDMLNADAEAKQADANARKAEAEAKIASETNKAASLRAAQEEEVLDMEDFNKNKDEQKKIADTRDKLIKYRHDVKNTTQKQDLGESMNHDDKKKFPDATPEEEEVLEMERWEKKKQEAENRKKTRERLLKFRAAKKAREAKKGSSSEVRQAVSGMATESIDKIRQVTFSKFNMLVENQVAGNTAQPEMKVGPNTKAVAKTIFEKMQASGKLQAYAKATFPQVEGIVNKMTGEKIKSDSDRKHIAVELFSLLQDSKG